MDSSVANSGQPLNERSHKFVNKQKTEKGNIWTEIFHERKIVYNIISTQIKIAWFFQLDVKYIIHSFVLFSIMATTIRNGECCVAYIIYFVYYEHTTYTSFILTGLGSMTTG